MTNLIKFGGGIILVIALHRTQPDPVGSGGVSGVVRFPDGSPSGGAKVSAKTECKGMPFTLVNEVTASSDGSFHIPAFEKADCSEVQLSAEKPEDLWLKTGRNVFYKGDNGTTPLINARRSGPPAHADIDLGIKGGLVNLRVRDTGSGKFIWAELSIEKIPQAEPEFGSIETATGRDGSPVPLLVPGGEYQVSILQYACKTTDDFARRPPRQTLVVPEGERITKDINLDIQLIEAAKTYSNPHGRACKL
jgi:hypothetical protein